MSDPCWRLDLGRRGFEETLSLQRRLVAARQQGAIPDVLIFVEHDPTYTIGRGGRGEHLLAGRDALEALGTRFIETDRGGDVTFHGPGQIVGYPIMDLTSWQRDVHAYLRALESVLIDAVGELGIHATREPGLTGIWHPKGKLGAIGVRVARWVTSHGFALNVATELDYFKHIVPCGIVDRAVSSMEDVLQAPVALGPVTDALARAYARVFDRNVAAVREADLEVVG